MRSARQWLTGTGVSLRIQPSLKTKTRHFGLTTLYQQNPLICLFHGDPEVEKILLKIDQELSTEAGKYPELKGSFSGLRKCRRGNYRVIFTIINDTVLILRIWHRKDVYK
jgi:mRNA interferase RelE/StbE